MRENLHKQGFSYDAIMWALIGVIGNISRGIGLSEEEIKKVTGDNDYPTEYGTPFFNELGAGPARSSDLLP